MIELINMMLRPSGNSLDNHHSPISIQELRAQLDSMEEWQKKLMEQNAELTARAKELEQRENALQQMHTNIREASNKLRQEHEQMKHDLSNYKIANTHQEDLSDIKKQFMTIRQELKQTQDRLIQLDNTVNYSACDGVRMLCNLYRNMSSSTEGPIQLYANELSGILQTRFDAVPIDPFPGDGYDSTIHERIDSSHHENLIVKCVARGWRWKDEILMRAVVETEEGSLVNESER